MPTTACKLCLVGEPGVGKSSLAQRLLRGQFGPASERPGITVATHQLPSLTGETIAITLWDVAGNCALDTLNQTFLSGIHAVAAVAVATSAASVEQALALIAQVRRFHPGVAAGLLLNKCDLATGRPVHPALPADVTAFEVSARDGRGVQSAFVELARRGVRNRDTSR